MPQSQTKVAISNATQWFSIKHCTQWRSQVIGIGRAPGVCLTITLTTLALTHTYTALVPKIDAKLQ